MLRREAFDGGRMKCRGLMGSKLQAAPRASATIREGHV